MLDARLHLVHTMTGFSFPPPPPPGVHTRTHSPGRSPSLRQEKGTAATGLPVPALWNVAAIATSEDHGKGLNVDTVSKLHVPSC